MISLLLLGVAALSLQVGNSGHQGADNSEPADPSQVAFFEAFPVEDQVGVGTCKRCCELAPLAGVTQSSRCAASGVKPVPTPGTSSYRSLLQKCICQHWRLLQNDGSAAKAGVRACVVELPPKAVAPSRGALPTALRLGQLPFRFASMDNTNHQIST
jgi:hypothetical protein